MMKVPKYTYIGPKSKVFIQGRTFNPQTWSHDEIRYWMGVYPKEVTKLFKTEFVDPPQATTSTQASENTTKSEPTGKDRKN